MKVIEIVGEYPKLIYQKIFLGIKSLVQAYFTTAKSPSCLRKTGL